MPKKKPTDKEVRKVVTEVAQEVKAEPGSQPAATVAAKDSVCPIGAVALEIEVRVTIKGDKAFIGVRGKDTDPMFRPLTIVHPEDALQEAFVEATGLLEEARARWATNPRNPKYEAPPAPTPAPTAVAAPARPAGAQPGRRAKAAAAPGDMTPMF